MIHELKALKLLMKDAENQIKGKQVAEVTVGSVTLSIFFSLNRIKLAPETQVAGTEGNGAPPIEFKTYDSFIIPYYEGSMRKTPRRSTLEKAKAFAKETATRLNKDGARAEFLSERDRRLFVLAKASAESLGLEIDELCRKHVELKQRLKSGTLEQAVDFHNDHGQKVKHGVDNTVIYEEYLIHLEKRGAGEYHLRDIKRYVGPFIEGFPGPISPIQTGDIDTHLASLDQKKDEKDKAKNGQAKKGDGKEEKEGRKTKARSKNNVRDAIIGYYNFAQEKGYLPQGIPHAASLTTEFRDKRQKITSEAQAIELLEPNDIYLPHEMAKLLVTAKEHAPLVLPTMEIKGFSGVRTEEMVRIWWVMVCEPEELIRIPGAVGKIDARRVPILPNLKRRLAAHPAELKRDRVWQPGKALPSGSDSPIAKYRATSRSITN